MTYRRATWLPRVLRSAGINVVCEKGWRRRGLSPSAGPFDPKYVVWHHDASAAGPSPGVVDFMLARFETAAAQLWVCMGCGGKHPVGTWHVLAAGRAPHAGTVLPGKPDNYDSLGVETDHTTGEEWHPELLASLRLGTAAILRHLRRNEQALEFHKTICSPPGRKTDPDGLNLSRERERVVAVMRARVPAVSATRVADAARKGRRGRGVRLVQQELRAAGYKVWPTGRFGPRTRRAYADWQRAHGYRGRAADGIPGPLTLARLGRRRRAFRVVE